MVEAGGEDAQLYVPVAPQELDHLVHTFEAGAPGCVPGDTAFLAWGQLHVQGRLHGVEPREEAEFCMTPLTGIELGEMEEEGGSGLAELAWGRAGRGGGEAPGSNRLRGVLLTGRFLFFTRSPPPALMRPSVPHSSTHPLIPTFVRPVAPAACILSACSGPGLWGPACPQGAVCWGSHRAAGPPGSRRPRASTALLKRGE